MTFEIDVNGRPRAVSVESAGPNRFRVSLDGVVHDVDATRIGSYSLSLLLSGASREVSVAPGPVPGILLVGLEGRSVGVTVNGRRKVRGGTDAAHAQGLAQIVAPMPGRVVRVLVAAGDDVAAKQGLVVIEAMKMENELRAPKAGRVKEVSVAPGTSVDAGRVLITLE